VLLLLLLLPQIIAFCLYSAPLYYMCEKALRVHTKPMYIRVLARLPVCELQLLLQPSKTVRCDRLTCTAFLD
jgi:hypothetical protein